MNNEFQLPDSLKKQIKSKRKILKLDFIDKLNLLLEWAGDDERKKNFIGIKKLENGDLLVNIPVLSKHFDIKDRSLSKNFNLSNYRAQKKVKGWFQFSKREDTHSIISTYGKIEQEIGKQEAENWNSEMLIYWDIFIKKYPDKKVSDFTIQFGKIKSILSLSQLIEYLIQSDIFDAGMFQFIFIHFSPMESISGKISTLLSSIFSRGWTIGEGAKTVNLIRPYGFLFDDGNQQIMVYNNLKCSYPGLWLFNKENSENYEPESFFETFFPRELPSNDNFIDIIVKYFPATLEGNDEFSDDNDD